MASLELGVRFTAGASGTGDFTSAGAVQGYRDASVLTSGNTFRYRAESSDLSQWEYGTGGWNGTTLARTTVKASSTGSKVSFSAAPQVAVIPFVEDLVPLNGVIFGLTLSTAGASGTFSVGTGFAADANAVDIMRLGSSISKTTSTWAVGNNSGGLDAGTIAPNTWYHSHLIKRVDTGVVDVLVSLSATAPTLPTGYTLFRRIGALSTNASSQWVYFHQLGDEFLWDTTIGNVSGATGDTIAHTVTTSVPTGIQVTSILNAAGICGTAGDGRFYVSELDKSDEAAAVSNVNVGSLGASGTQAWSRILIRTNTSAQIRYRALAATGLIYIGTAGWIDTRGRLY